MLIVVGLPGPPRRGRIPDLRGDRRAKKQQTKVPIVELFRKHWLLVILAALVFAGNNAAGYMTTGGFMQTYTTNPNGPIGFERTPVLLAVAGAAAMWLLFTLLARLPLGQDRPPHTYHDRLHLPGADGVFPLFTLVNTGLGRCCSWPSRSSRSAWASTYGPQAALYSELFPASIRFSGVSISYALGAILGGAFAPMIATALVQATGGTNAVAVYLLIMTLVSLTAVLTAARPQRHRPVDQQPGRAGSRCDHLRQAHRFRRRPSRTASR